MALSDELMDILASPGSNGIAPLLENQSTLACTACAVKYPIRDCIPVMLVSEPKRLRRVTSDQ